MSAYSFLLELEGNEKKGVKKKSRFIFRLLRVLINKFPLFLRLSERSERLESLEPFVRLATAGQIIKNLHALPGRELRKH